MTYVIKIDKAESAIANKVAVGDYVNYPVTYTNVGTGPYSGTTRTSSYTGWRVVYNDGTTVRIATAGTPLTYSHGTVSSTSHAAVTTNFATTFSDFYAKCTTGTAAKFTSSVSSFNKTEVDVIIGRAISDNTNVSGNNVLHNGSHWWIPSQISTSVMGFLDGNNGKINCKNGSSKTLGIRPMVTIKAGTIITSGSGTSASPWVMEI